MSITAKKLLKEWNCLSSFQCSLPIIIKFSEKKHLVCKIPQFWTKATNSDSPSSVFRKWTPLCFVPWGEPKKSYISAHGLIQTKSNDKLIKLSFCWLSYMAHILVHSKVCLNILQTVVFLYRAPPWADPSLFSLHKKGLCIPNLHSVC